MADALPLRRPQETQPQEMAMPPALVSGRHTDCVVSQENSVAVVVRLVGTGHVNADVLGLLLGELGELDPDGG